MTETLHVVNRERHAYKKWLPASNYGFATTIHSALVGAAELTSAARFFPLAFVEAGGKFSFAALFSLEPGRNLFVAPNGRWLTGYVPAALQTYPFSFARKNDGKFAVCVNESSGLVKDAAVGEQGHPFFDADGTLTRDTQQVVDFLTSARRGLDSVATAVEVLAARRLLEPWPITLKNETGDRRIGGIARINEAALNALGAEDLKALRDVGGLAVAYCQLVSLGNISVLDRLAEAHDRARTRRMAIPESSFVAEDDGNLKIDWSQFIKDD